MNNSILFFLALLIQKSRNNEKLCGVWSVAAFPHAAVSVRVVGLWAFALDTGTIHISNAAQLVVRVAPTA